jgi:hypothetical protein
MGRGAWEIITGRLVIISAIDTETIEIELTSISAAGQFKFHHDSKLQVQLRCRYTLDEMADDLLGDKIRTALDHLDCNPAARAGSKHRHHLDGISMLISRLRKLQRS